MFKEIVFGVLVYAFLGFVFFSLAFIFLKFGEEGITPAEIVVSVLWPLSLVVITLTTAGKIPLYLIKKYYNSTLVPAKKRYVAFLWRRKNQKAYKPSKVA
jgi:uncharacterized membrane protein